MSLLDGSPEVHFVVHRTEGRVSTIETTSPLVNHFLTMLKVSRSWHTWVNYAFDLKIFFTVIPKLPEAVTRADCLAFIVKQQEHGLAPATINRRLAAVASLFRELALLDPVHFATNPVNPEPAYRRPQTRTQSLYRKHPQRIPDILSEETLQAFLAVLPSWRDVSLVFLLWMSCLRLNEALSLTFHDVECSRRSLYIRAGKGNLARMVSMDRYTFAALNRYLDEERKNLFPEEDALFVAFKGRNRGKPLRDNAVQHAFRYYADKAKIPHLHAHLFRHTGITQLVKQGMTEAAIRKFVGHRRPESLLPYLHLCDDFVAQEFEQAYADFTLRGIAPSDLEGGPR